MSEAGETLVEWLRNGCLGDCPPDCETCGNLRKAADRIEALERENSDLRHDIAQLVDCEADKEIERLKAALREIEADDLPINATASSWEILARRYEAIARDALEGKE